MNTRRDVTVREYTFSPEDQERLLDDTLLEWRELGPTAVWDAMYEILDWWFAVRGLDPRVQRVDRTHFEIHPVPWASADSSDGRRI